MFFSFIRHKTRLIISFQALKSQKNFFLLVGHKEYFIAPCGQTNLFFDPQVEKNRVQHGKNIYFTRVKIYACKINFFSLDAQYTFFFQGPDF